MNSNRMVSLLQDMVKINTVNPPGDEQKLAELLCNTISTYGLECKLYQVEKDRTNIVVILRGRNPTQKKIYFNGHLDTVPIGEQPWTTDPFGAEIRDGRIYGRGTTDMKGGIAAFLETMIILKESNYNLEQDIVFVGTVGEEVDCLGAQAAVKQGLIEDPGAIIIAEPSGLDLYVAHKGALWIEIKTYGKTAHGSMPSEGINAIDSMISILTKIKQLKLNDIDELLGTMTQSINIINGGVATNVIPDSCSVNLDFRTVTAKQNHSIMNKIDSVLKNLSKEQLGFKADYTILHNIEPLKNKNESDFIEKLKEVNQEMYGKGMESKGANYYTDGSIFRKHFDCPILIFGAGDTALAHQPDESISIHDLEKSVKFYLKAVDLYQESQIIKEMGMQINE
ncbi:M20 family metallopeptidase [Sporosarcina obsidiansis]|uniref:M20 family metallopeptidase n=1 Tax=Sporosarcina obsidiansis TaxID=2660748 RepID=UPI00129BA423|nr:M20 family metallopeptidase [Sporosarcina obsidiansis]